jgi:hypothetical protein
VNQAFFDMPRKSVRNAKKKRREEDPSPLRPMDMDSTIDDDLADVEPMKATGRAISKGDRKARTPKKSRTRSSQGDGHVGFTGHPTGPGENGQDKLPDTGEMPLSTEISSVGPNTADKHQSVLEKISERRPDGGAASAQESRSGGSNEIVLDFSQVYEDLPKDDPIRKYIEAKELQLRHQAAVARLQAEHTGHIDGDSGSVVDKLTGRHGALEKNLTNQADASTTLASQLKNQRDCLRKLLDENTALYDDFLRFSERADSSPKRHNYDGTSSSSFVFPSTELHRNILKPASSNVDKSAGRPKSVVMEEPRRFTRSMTQQKRSMDQSINSDEEQISPARSPYKRSCMRRSDRADAHSESSRERRGAEFNRNRDKAAAKRDDVVDGHADKRRCRQRSRSQRAGRLDSDSEDEQYKWKQPALRYRKVDRKTAETSDDDDENRNRHRQSELSTSLLSLSDDDEQSARLAHGIRMPRFGGEPGSDVDVFLKQFESCFKGKKWSEADKLVNLYLQLDGAASTLITQYPKLSYRKFVHRLREQFGKEFQAEVCESELFTRVRQPGETIPQLKGAIKRLASWAYPGEEGRVMYERATRDSFIRALNDRWLQDEIWRQNPRDIQDAARLASQFETHYAKNRLSKGPSGGQQTVPRASVRAVGRDDQTDNSKPWSNDIESIRKLIGDLKSDYKSSIELLRQDVKRTVSNNLQTGSNSNIQAVSSNYGTNRRNLQKLSSNLCRKCGKEGHWKINCPDLTMAEKTEMDQRHERRNVNKKPRQTGNPAATSAIVNVNTNATDNVASKSCAMQYGGKCYFVVYMAGEPYRVLADTGSLISLIGLSFIPPGMNVEPYEDCLNAANKSEIRLIGKVELSFRLQPDDVVHKQTVLVSPDIDDIIFGYDYLAAADCDWRVSRGTAVMYGLTVKMHPHLGGPQVRRIYAAESVVIPPMNEADVPVNVPMNHIDDRAPALVLDARFIAPGVVTANAVLPGYRPECILRVVNLNNRPFELDCGRLLTEAVPYISEKAVNRLREIDNVENEGHSLLSNVLAVPTDFGGPDCSTYAAAERATINNNNFGPQTACNKIPLRARVADRSTEGSSAVAAQMEAHDEGECCLNRCLIHSYDRKVLPFSPALHPVIKTVASVCCSRDCDFCSSDHSVDRVCRSLPKTICYAIGRDCDGEDNFTDSEDNLGPTSQLAGSAPVPVDSVAAATKPAAAGLIDRTSNEADTSLFGGPSFASAVTSAQLGANKSVRPAMSAVVDTVESPIAQQSSRARLIGEFAHLTPLVDALPSDLSEAQVTQITELLMRNKDVFSSHKYDLGCTDLIEVRIPTGNAKPHAEGLRSHPRAYLDLIDAEIEAMRQADVIEPAQSSWNANIVCVKKKMARTFEFVWTCAD